MPMYAIMRAGRPILATSILIAATLLGSSAAFAKAVKVDTVTLEVPDIFKVSKSTRGVKLQTADKEVYVWLETYKLDEKKKVMQSYDKYWSENDVELSDPTVRDISEPGGSKQEIIDYKDAKWQGKPTVVGYVSIGPITSENKIILFTIWASPEGFKTYGKDILAVLQEADLNSGGAAAAPAEAQTSAANSSAPATLSDLEAQENATAAVWERLPFSSRHVMFVTRKAGAYGDYAARPSSVFEPGEQLLTYIEPLGYAWSPQGGSYRIGVTVDFEILSKTGKILGGQKEILKQEFESHYRNREFYINSTMTVDGAPAGDYVLAYTLHDLGSGRTARIEQPFSIKGAAGDAN